MEAPISTKPRNLELVQKIISERNLISTIRTRVRIPELNKKIEQPKKKEECNQKKTEGNYINKNDNRNRKINQIFVCQEQSLQLQKIQ
jgi:hypothetical protein